MEFVDTHCHIIPGVDDGPADADESVRMGRLAAEDGIKTIVATPHIVEGIYSGVDLEERIASLEAIFIQKGIGIKLVAGAEVPISLCHAGDAATLKKLTIGGGDFLLVETSGITLEQLFDVVARIRTCGIYPVLAHPERTLFTEDEIGRLCAGNAAGNVFIQVTAASIEGLFGKKTQKKCMNLVMSGLVHLIATDAHSDTGRVPLMSKACSIISRRIGDGAAILLQKNPRRVLENKKPQSTGLAGRRSGKSFLSKVGGRMGV